MADVIIVAAIVAFFVLSALYVTWCDRILGADDFAVEPAADEALEPEAVAA